MYCCYYIMYNNLDVEYDNRRYKLIKLGATSNGIKYEMKQNNTYLQHTLNMEYLYLDDAIYTNYRYKKQQMKTIEEEIKKWIWMGYERLGNSEDWFLVPIENINHFTYIVKHILNKYELKLMNN